MTALVFPPSAPVIDLTSPRVAKTPKGWTSFYDVILLSKADGEVGLPVTLRLSPVGLRVLNANREEPIWNVFINQIHWWKAHKVNQVLEIDVKTRTVNHRLYLKSPEFVAITNTLDAYVKKVIDERRGGSSPDLHALMNSGEHSLNSTKLIDFATDNDGFEEWTPRKLPTSPPTSPPHISPPSTKKLSIEVSSQVVAKSKSHEDLSTKNYDMIIADSDRNVAQSAGAVLTLPSFTTHPSALSENSSQRLIVSPRYITNAPVGDMSSSGGAAGVSLTSPGRVQSQPNISAATSPRYAVSPRIY